MKYLKLKIWMNVIDVERSVFDKVEDSTGDEPVEEGTTEGDPAGAEGDKVDSGADETETTQTFSFDTMDFEEDN